MMSVPATVICALAVALGLNRIASLKWRNVWAAMYFLPFSTSLGAYYTVPSVEALAGVGPDA